ncbi:hypothetical protein B0H19DRAFT_930349, partial [Mycena capillaripes]
MLISTSLESFLPHATQFGFFLHLERFREATLLPFPLGDTRRPSPALLYAVYLWAIHLSQDHRLTLSENIFFNRAQQHILTVTSAETNPKDLLHIIQAQLLLSMYLFRAGDFCAAQIHVDAAAALALDRQLHKMRSAPVNTPVIFADPVGEGERVRAFWAIACLQSHLSISFGGGTSTFCIFDSIRELDTPWPLEIEDY